MKNYVIPLKEDLAKYLGISPTKAKQIRSLIRRRIAPEGFTSVLQWLKTCHNKPQWVELVMEALNEITGGHGVESIRDEHKSLSGYWMDCAALYVNQGDTYANTIIYDTENDEFLFMPWGDWIENLTPCEN